MKRLTVALIAALSSPLVLAAEKPYIGIDYQIGTLTAFNTDVKPETFRLRAGTEITPYLGVEAQAGANTQPDTLSRPGVDYEIKIDSYYALFVRPQISLGGVASIYGLLGGTYMDVSSHSNNSAFPSDTGFDKSFSYGGGIDFNIYHGIRLSADYIQYLDDYSAVSAGIRFPIN